MRAFTPNGENTVLEVNIHVVWPEAWKVLAGEVGLVGLGEVERGRPAHRVVARKRWEQVVEQSVEFAPEAKGRLESSECVHTSRG